MNSDYSRKKLLALLVCMNLIILSGLSYYGENNQSVSNNKVILSGFISSILSRDIKPDTLGATINKAEAIGVYIDDELYGYVANEQEGEEVVKRVAKLYAEEINTPIESIEGVNVKGKIDFKKYITDIDNISTVDSVANKILDKGNLYVDLIVKDKRDVLIEPKLEIINTDDLVLGDRKIKEGESGIKEQELKVVYRNGEIYDTNILSENIVASSKNKIIYNGTGNPVAMGVAFLKNPTKGGFVTSEFGMRWGRMHNGVDIGNEMGKPVYAAFDGEVKRVLYDAYGYGKFIIIEHDKGLETRYAHLSSYNVKEGDTVKKGEKIGEIGSTGRSTGPHLHFELRHNGDPVDPMKYIE